MPTAIIFAEPHINIVLAWKETIIPNLPNVKRFAWVPHYYDLLTLLSKSFRKWMVRNKKNVEIKKNRKKNSQKKKKKNLLTMFLFCYYFLSVSFLFYIFFLIEFFSFHR